MAPSLICSPFTICLTPVAEIIISDFLIIDGIFGVNSSQTVILASEYLSVSNLYKGRPTIFPYPMIVVL